MSQSTWNNRPSSSGTLIATINAGTVGEEYSVDVTSYVSQEAAGDGKASFVLVQPSGVSKYVGFGSRENPSETNRPVLVWSGSGGPPPAPSGLIANSGDAQVELSWNASANAVSYNVKRSLVSGGLYALVAANVMATSYIDGGLDNGTLYYYVVSAVNAAGESGDSAEAGAMALSDLQTWRVERFGTIEPVGNAADDADPDGDGMTNLKEFYAGTEPNEPGSVLRILQIERIGNDIVIEFPSVSGRIYRLERSSTMETGSWQTVQDAIEGTGGSISITDPGAGADPACFYRIVVEA